MKNATHSRAIRYLQLAFTTLVLSVAGAAVAETVLITGANSGIGLELSKQYAAKGWTVIATHRRDTAPDTLAALAKAHPKVRVEKMDVSSHDQVFGLAKKLRGEPIDVLINNAGLFCICDWEDDKDNSQQFGTLNYDHFMPIMKANVMGVIMVAEAFAENVKASRQKKLITMSSSVGTISRPGRGAFWYSSSKAAVNKITVNLAAVLKSSNVIVVPIHPGAVRVEKQANDPGTHLIDTDFSVRHIIATIDGLTMAGTGKFTNYDGKELPW
jgi:NAD(P)-dependent dehydrogenase (short-subunit alcohol dehydrogenase family)